MSSRTSDDDRHDDEYDDDRIRRAVRQGRLGGGDALLGGDEIPGFDAFFRSNYTRLRGLLKSRGAPLDLADEVADWAFATLQHRWPYLKDDNLTAYLNKIAIRRLGRRTKPYWANLAAEERAAFEALTAIARPESGQVEDWEISPKMRRCLNTLQSTQRAAVVLRYFRELEFVEIAEFMEVEEGSVRVYLHRGIKKLGLALEEYSKMSTTEDGKGHR